VIKTCDRDGKIRWKIINEEQEIVIVIAQNMKKFDKNLKCDYINYIWYIFHLFSPLLAYFLPYSQICISTLFDLN